MNSKKKEILFIIVCLIVLSIGAYFWYIDGIKKDAYQNIKLEFNTAEESYEVGTELNAINFIKKTNAEEVDYPVIDSSKVGEHTFVYVAKDKYGNEREFILVLVFVDSIKPILTLTQNEASITEGDSIDFESFIKEAYDPVDGKLKVSISIPKDYLSIGTHDIEFSITDKHKNTVKAKLTLVVNEKIKDEEKPKEEEKGTEKGKNDDSDGNDDSVDDNKQQKPSNKRYLFSQGYDMTTAPSVCKSDLLNSKYPGECNPITDSNGIYIGVELIFY